MTRRRWIVALWFLVVVTALLEWGAEPMKLDPIAPPLPRTIVACRSICIG